MKRKGLIDEAADLFEGGYGREAAAARLGVNDGTVRSWEYACGTLGKEALLNGKNMPYSQDLKLEAARMLLDDGMTKSRIMDELGIKSKSALERWIREYRVGGAAALEPKPRGSRTGRTWFAFGFTWRGRGRRAVPRHAAAGFLAIWKNNAFEAEKTPVWHENARWRSKTDSFSALYATCSVKLSINLAIEARLSVGFVPKREKDGRGGRIFPRKAFAAVFQRIEVHR